MLHSWVLFLYIGFIEVVCGEVESQVSFNVNNVDYDPYEKAVNILSDKIRYDDEIDYYSKKNISGIDITIPVDYSEDEQEFRYKKFWKSEATTWQKEAIGYLTISSDKFNNTAATLLLAQIHLWGEYGYPNNKTLAYSYLNKYNEMIGFTDGEALFDLAVMLSTGLFGAIPIDIGKSLLYYQQAASLGNMKAKQALAYRYANGLNVPRDCNMALLLYRELSDEVRSKYSDYEWNVALPYMETYNIRIPDFQGGLLGEGLSSTHSSTTRKDSVRPDITSSLLTQMNGGQIVLQFGIGAKDYAADGESDDSNDKLVDLYYTAWDLYKGTYERNRDVESARTILELAIEVYSSSEPYMDNLQIYFFGKCYYLLGHIYFTGEGISKPDIERAQLLLQKSIDIVENVSAVKSKANIDMGLINQFIKNDTSKAIKYYRNVLEENVNDGTADYQLSKLSSEKPELNLGDPFVLMQTAYRRSHIAGTYEYAKMIEESVNNYYSCEDTSFLFKRFLEMNEVIVAPQLRIAFSELLKGNTEVALWAYAQAAEQGFEAAQISAAYLLYQDAYLMEEVPETTDERKSMAISYYNRAFKQNNIDAAIIAGNIFYNMKDYSKAIAMYQSASLRFAPQAIWNLGYMYEHGLGVGVDYKMAHDYYNQVLDHNPELFFAVKLTVMKLTLKSWISWLSGEPVSFWNQDKEEIDGVSIISQEEQMLSQMSIFRRFKYSVEQALLENSGHHAYPTPLTEKQINDKQQEKKKKDEKNDPTDTGWVEKFIMKIDELGLSLEDVLSIMFMAMILLVTMIIRPLIIRAGWNVRINGIVIRGNAEANGEQEQPQEVQPANIDIQFFAI
ncbi:hypothetical protein TPHA_0D04540 [Tetrapisispora phaffii CBS 4417]|uniref:ERAD-associated E3 ubiquitin-protein ligase component HRD3 n=1 Tax=Tetrapisispora phaffii (strain ATCC 24235 / CBS 4417 / NBRC 1672 / NRRL Y-8282 / UCD 70-5) TaxID=1071381 RepID=G8BS13_TETPH|nr:hypothetical protein TPHA_0D04540 [Tetrapisispora phaffii CBS 4417]CCE63088.1 hypothetical protein TPHA_0D04540 [Tetrapisispora phaffii CBS 4417]